MNLVGKIFTVLIFVMCVVFASFALMLHAAHKNWRDEDAKQVALLDKANEDIAKLQQENKRIAEGRVNDQDRFKETTRKLQAANDDLTKQIYDPLTGYKSQREQLQGQLRQVLVDIKLLQQNLANLRDESAALRDANRVAVADREKVWKTYLTTSDEATNRAEEIARLEKRLRDLVEQYNVVRMRAEYDKNRAADLSKEPPAGLSSEVVAVRQSDVEIGVGYDDGVRKGHRFSVTRPSTGSYVGDIEVVRVDWPNRAVCRPIKDMQRDLIQKGDYVKANLSRRR
jgi:hypothetical protein